MCCHVCTGSCYLYVLVSVVTLSLFPFVLLLFLIMLYFVCRLIIFQ